VRIVETDRPLEVGVAFDEIGDPTGLAPLSGADEAAEAHPQSPDGHGKIAAVQEATETT